MDTANRPRHGTTSPRGAHSDHKTERPPIDGEIGLRISAELEAAVLDVQMAITNARARLIQVVNQELGNAFDQAIAGMKEIPLVPPIAGPRPIAPDSSAPEDPPNGHQDPAPRLNGGGGQSAHDGDGKDPAVAVVEVTAVWPEQADDDTSPEEGAERPAADARQSPALGVDEGHPDDEVFKGTVRLNVEANGGIRRVVQFVDDLCQRPEFRLLRLVGNHHGAGVDIWLGLREPVCLKRMLMQMKGVSQVVSPLGNSPNGHERFLNVWLASEPQGE